MFEPTKEELIEALWAKHVYPFLEKKPSTREERAQAALIALEHLRSRFDRASTGGATITPRLIQLEAAKVWSLFVTETAGWLLPFDLSMSKDDYAPELKQASNEANDTSFLLSFRSLLRYLLLPTVSRTFAPVLDPVAVLLPQWLFEMLADSMDALEKGEVHPLVEPSTPGKHGPAWSWDNARVRAVQHVNFLAGTGVTKEIARQRVSAALKRVPVATLLDWEHRRTRWASTVHTATSRLRTASARKWWTKAKTKRRSRRATTRRRRCKLGASLLASRITFRSRLAIRFSGPQRLHAP
jgi:hypothetical protein